VRERAREVNRLCKVLEDSNLKLTSVLTDVMGVSGRSMLTALVQGTTDPAVLAELARGRLRKKLPDLRRALAGRFRRHHSRQNVAPGRIGKSPEQVIERVAGGRALCNHMVVYSSTRAAWSRRAVITRVGAAWKGTLCSTDGCCGCRLG
jgi:hypothetical protein